MKIERITSLEQLDEDQRDLAEIIGMEAYKKLLVNYAGCVIYVRKPERIGKQIRDAKICQKFNGSNYKELAKEFYLSESSVRKIIRNAINKHDS